MLVAGDLDVAFGLPVRESRAVVKEPPRDLGSDDDGASGVRVLQEVAEYERPGEEPPLRLRAAGAGLRLPMVQIRKK